MKLYKATPEEWATLSESVHSVTFAEYRPVDQNRYTFVLVCAGETDITAYSTIIEMDKDTAYMQHGGALPNIKGTISSYRNYQAMITWLKDRYKRISTRISNKNVAMIKFALSEGLIIDGCFLYEGEVYLSLGWGF